MINERIADSDKTDAQPGFLSRRSFLVGSAASIGALAPLSALEHSPEVARHAPVIVRAMKRLSNVRVRNVATVGGALAHGDPHMDLPPVLIAVVAGAALLGPLTGALATSVHRDTERFAAVLAFGVTASGVTLAGIGAAFWGLVAGLLALGLERLARRR